MSALHHIPIRRPTTGARPITEDAQAVLLQRAAALKPRDRLMLDLAFRRKLTVREIAQLLHKDAGTISRTIQRLCSRLRDPMIAALLDQQSPLSPEYRQLALEHFAQGKPIKELSDLHQMTMPQTRQMLNFVRDWHRSMYRRSNT